MSEQLEDYQRALSEIATTHNDSVSCRAGTGVALSKICAGCVAARVLEKWQKKTPDPPAAPIRGFVFADPVEGQPGRWLVTLECGHKKFTAEQALQYVCRECSGRVTPRDGVFKRALPGPGRDS